LLIILFFSFLFIGCLDEKSVEILVEGKGGYLTIQSAIDDARDGDTIIVKEGSINEKIIIDKTINLIGSGIDKTFLSYSDIYADRVNIILVTADNCKIDGFTIKGGKNYSNIRGIVLESSNNFISNNSFSRCNYGIYLNYSSVKNKILRNRCYNNNYGMVIRFSDNNSLSYNDISFNNKYGIWIYWSNFNEISRSLITTNNISKSDGYGIRIQDSHNNTIYGNVIKNNLRGMYFCCGSTNNTIFKNNFEDNVEWNAKDDRNNSWYHEGIGNFWDDYPVQNPNSKDENLDDIWDIPYIVSSNNSDLYPSRKLFVLN
jgi:parallel beta-helix repeat protein